MLPSSAELEYFLEISHSLNLSRASEKLGISQPSLSLALKRLEQSLDATLFIRHKKGVALTPAGKQLVLHARQLLHDWHNTKSQVLDAQKEIQGYFTLGCNSIIASYVVTKFLPNLLAKNPKLEIHLKHAISRKITEQVINLSVDIGIVINPMRHPDIIIKKLYDDEVGFFCGPGLLPLQDIRSPQLTLLCEPELTQTQLLLKKSKKMGITPQRIITMNSLEVVANLTAHGCGVGILPGQVVKLMHPDKLKKIPNTPTCSDE